MSTLAARRLCRARRQARLQAQHKCRCGRLMDRIGKLCQHCTTAHARICRQRYRRTAYGSGWTVALITRASALALRGWV